MLRHTDGPRRAVRMTVIASALKKLRQNVTSKLCAASRWRVTTPAMLHSRVTRTISETARAWVIEVRGMGCVRVGRGGAAMGVTIAPIKARRRCHENVAGFDFVRRGVREKTARMPRRLLEN